MDSFVCNKLQEWGLSDYIQTFKDHEINEHNFSKLDDDSIKELFPKVGPRTDFKDKLKSLMKQQTLVGPNKETVTSTVQVLPSTSNANETKRRTQESQGNSPVVKRQRLQTVSERKILFDVKVIMENIKIMVQSGEKTTFTDFLKKKIDDLETEKREQIGVFGRTGSGKSSLINAIIGEKNLLPSGSVSACTAVMFRVEANNHSPKYEAEIEFIQKEEWKDELWLWKNFPAEEKDTDVAEKLTAVYGEDWEVRPIDELMDERYFREIKEFLNSTKKIMKCDTAEELSARFVRYISDSSGVHGQRSRQYWPLVKCVTIKVPEKDLLQHVTLVDLPGNGDRNNSRDQMWKTVVGSCSTVWVVADINRAVAEKEPWEILENASSLLGNGGECQKIVFICTKSDNIDDHDEQSAFRECVLKRNKEAKAKVMAEFKKQSTLRRHFNDECFEVFTVSSKEFFKKERKLRLEDTEIPKLKEFVQNLNDCHSETLRYVTGAHGILSLIHGARQQETDHKMKASRDLQENLEHQKKECYNKLNQTYMTFDQCLSEGVKNAEVQCEISVKKIVHPKGVKGAAFHKKLGYAVRNNGVFKAKKGSKTKNINMDLSSPLTKSIDEVFKKTFPNQREHEPFQGAIGSFSLGTEELMKKYKDVELQLSFLKTEEDKIKTKLYKITRDGKKTIYSTLTKTIEENMQKCYKDAADIAGPGVLEYMRFAIENCVWDKKHTMFKTAKENMLEELNKLMTLILTRLQQTLKESIELSLQMDASSLPDVTGELKIVKKFKDELEGSANPDRAVHRPTSADE